MKREVMKMLDMEGREGLVEEIIPFGSGEFDYDDGLEIYDEEFEKELENLSNENEDCAMISIELRCHNSYNTVSV